MFLHQFTDFMILVLIGACIVSALLGEWIEAVAILAVVLFNGIMGFVQEFKAEKSLAALKKINRTNGSDTAKWGDSYPAILIYCPG